MCSKEEYILDIKVEDTETIENPNKFNFSSNCEILDDSDCSTITASEVNSTISASDSSFKQKKLRVLIKKLPQRVLDVYFGRKDIHSSMSYPRVSKRLRNIPSKYRSANIYMPHSSRPGRYIHIMDISENAKKGITQTKSQNEEYKSLGITKNSVTISKTQWPLCTNIINKTANKTPPTISNKMNSVEMDSSNILVIRQPVLKNDPLNIPRNTNQVVNRESDQNVNKGTEKETEMDTNQVTDKEDNNEPEVVKRIYFASKSVQTKFTCNGNICGLVDSDEFNLNCFYCYEIFPFHKWFEFKEHVKVKHYVEEKQNQEQDPIEELAIPEPTPNKSLLKAQEANRNKVKTTDGLNIKTCVPETYYISNQERISLYKPAKNPQLNPVVKFIKVAKNPAPKTQLTNNQLNQNSLPRETVTNSQMQQPKEFIDLSSENEKQKSPSIEDTSYVDEIITIGDEEDEKVDKEVSKSSPPKLATFKNTLSSNTNTNKRKIFVLQPNGNLPISKNISFPKPKNATVEKLSESHFKNITIKKIDKSASNKSDSTSITSPEALQSQSILKKAYIKLPSNLSIEEVLKTIPKPISPQNASTTASTKPRYFVVKKVTKPSGNEKESTINLPKDTVISTIASTSPKQKTNDDDDDMPSNDENEDEIPKPTNGCGILFGLTNREVVVEFLLKLKTFPELWRPHLNNATIDYNKSIRQVCTYLNEKFDLNIQDFEMRLSIQRVKDWYCRMLKNIYMHNQDPSNKEPYKHTFPVYFEILNKFLTSDVHYTKNLLLCNRFKATNTSMSDYPKWMVYKTGQSADNISKIHLDEQTKLKPKPKPKPQPEPPKKKPIIKFKPTKLPEDDSTQNVIEFDADTLYAVDTADESLTLPPKQPVKKKKTKIYNPVVPFVCDVCERHFKRRTDLRRHHVLHFPPKFKCSVCSRMFHYKYNADNCSHSRKKKKNDSLDDNAFRQWMCEICGLSYRSMASLIAHNNEKHLNRRLKCVVCKFTAVSNYRIVQHQKKRHVVEPGTVEEIAKKCRPRMDTITRYTPEARREFEWRREMRKKLKPGELFHGCCKCRLILKTRKEKLLHNKLEHPIKDTTVICLLCLPQKTLFSNSNSVRRHYTDMHKVPWDEIDDLVKRTKPIFKLLTTEEIEQLHASENSIELLKQIITKRNIKLDSELIKEESTKENDHIPNEINQQLRTEQAVNDENHQIETSITRNSEENVYVDGIIDHDYEHYDNDQDNQECMDHEVTNEENLNQVKQNIDNDIVIDNDQDIVYNDDGTTIQCQTNNDQEEIHVDDDGSPFEYDAELVYDELVEESIVEEEIIEFLEENSNEDSL